MPATPTMDKKRRLSTQTKRMAIAAVSGFVWLIVIVAQTFIPRGGVPMLVLEATAIVSCIVFFWNLAQSTMERSRRHNQHESITK